MKWPEAIEVQTPLPQKNRGNEHCTTNFSRAEDLLMVELRDQGLDVWPRTWDRTQDADGWWQGLPVEVTAIGEDGLLPPAKNGWNRMANIAARGLMRNGRQVAWMRCRDARAHLFVVAFLTKIPEEQVGVIGRAVYVEVEGKATLYRNGLQVLT